MSTPVQVPVTNQLDDELVVYTTKVSADGSNPQADPSQFVPTYTRLDTIPGSGSKTLSLDDPVARLVFTRSSDDFPLKVFATNPVDFKPQPVTITADDQSNAEAALSFYKKLKSEPYAPVSLQFTELVLDTSNVLTLDSQVAKFLSENGYKSADYTNFTSVSYWAENRLAGWNGTYYGFEPKMTPDSGFIVPKDPVGTISISGQTASFTPSEGGSPTSLTFDQNILASAGATATSGIKLHGVVRNLQWEGKPDTIQMFWVGTRDGAKFAVQPYKTPDLPWWVAAYNLAFATFLVVQVALVIDMAAHVLKGAGKGLKWLSDNARKLYSKIRSNTEDASTEADPEAAAGDDVDPINVDVDVDVDIDTDVVTDTDNVTDTDVDVDIDIDIDIDEDVFSVIDVDVDVDVDIDTDVVTDTDNVTDTDVDTDVDVDTEVDVQPGGIKGLLSKVGRWLMTKGFPAVAKNLVIMGAMVGAQKLLAVWKKQDEQDLANMSPQQATGFGLLLNYMLTSKVDVKERWTTFADYVQQQNPSVSEQQMCMSSILMFKNDTADANLKNWKWSKDDENALVNTMAQYTDAADQYKAYQALAAATHDGKALPVKVGAGVAVKYLAKIG